MSLARKLLRDVAKDWPSDMHLDCLSTCGAFLVFESPVIDSTAEGQPLPGC